MCVSVVAPPLSWLAFVNEREEDNETDLRDSRHYAVYPCRCC